MIIKPSVVKEVQSHPSSMMCPERMSSSKKNICKKEKKDHLKHRKISGQSLIPSTKALVQDPTS